MASEAKFGMLRKVLRAIGLSQQASDDVVDFIGDLLAGERKGSDDTAATPAHPYHLRDDFLSPAELSFYGVLRSTLDGRATICTKVDLRDLFYVKRDDPSRYRIYTNKIDRKHIDFLLCDPATMRPLVGIELDDKSHQRKDRQERDTFVDGVFAAAGLALVRISAKRAYHTDEVYAQIEPYLKTKPTSEVPPANVVQDTSAPVCPKCGSEMTLRIATKGKNAGQQFWGCPNYPACRAILRVELQPDI